MNNECDGELLYNYMTIEKFESLLSSNKWKFSDIKNSNDFKERKITCRQEIMKKNDYDIRKIKFSCFSSDWRIAPMWYFYAGNYTGVCVEFSKEKIEDRYKDVEFRKIEYVPIYNPKFQNKNNSKDYLSIKTPEWEYEKEIRMFYTGEYDSLIEILDCVTRVYTGNDCILNHLPNEYLKKWSHEGNLRKTWATPDGTIWDWRGIEY